MGINLNLHECLNMEYRIMIKLIRNKKSDFHEGVRALLIDKDKKPKWHPNTIEDVPDDMINQYFECFPQHHELNLS